MLQGWGGVVGGFIVFVSVLLSPVCGPTGSPQLSVSAVCPMVTGTLSATVLRVSAPVQILVVNIFLNPPSAAH